MTPQDVADLGATLQSLGAAVAERSAYLDRRFHDRCADDPSLAEMDEMEALVDATRDLRQAMLNADLPVPELPADVLDVLGPPFDAGQRCEMFCDRPIGPDGTQARDGGKAACPDCMAAMDHLAREVLPAVRRDGYWSPPDATVDAEFAALQRQAGFRPAMGRLLADILGEAGARAVMDPS